ncbi:MAG TPA: FAD-dependent oxidoreductase, partial [Desulfurivibrionaceae bacterium]|nr:FAD-dependent oxidoreductase [Desulfurivibrionaceae bacterium]
MSKKYGVYVCTGCGIGDALDIEGVTGVAGSYSMTAKTHEALCSEAGRQMIKDDMANDGVNTAVICACSPRVWKEEFSFGDDKLTVRANLREGVVWSAEQPTEERSAETIAEYTNELAQDYVRMACVQAQKMELPEPYKLETINKRILVMGGGVAGLTAAKEAAKAGCEVLLVEKNDKLGGKALGWRKQMPTKAPWTDLEEPTIQALVSAVSSDPKITVKTATEVARIAGAPGDYSVTLKAAGTKSEWDAPAKVGVDEQDKIAKGQMEDPNAGLKNYMEADAAAEKVGAVVLATGWNPADVSEYEHLGFGKLANVVTNAQFEKLAKEGKVPANVAFIMSPGGETHDKDFPYCNSVTSMVALKQAQYVRQDNADGKAYILYQHMRTPGNMEMFYKGAQNNDGIFLTKATVTGVAEEGGALVVQAKDTLLQENLELKVDMVVLAAGMVPTTSDAPTINLSYRQGPSFLDLELFDGYADSNFICFPYETRRTGVYACGGVRKATDMVETIDDACGAALKAIQCIES